MLDFAAIASVVSAITGSVGTSWWILSRIFKVQVSHLKELHKQQMELMDQRLGGLEDDVEEMCKRQKTLREETLPNLYVMRREMERCQADRKEVETTLFRKVNTVKGGP